MSRLALPRLVGTLRDHASSRQAGNPHSTINRPRNEPMGQANPNSLAPFGMSSMETNSPVGRSALF